MKSLKITTQITRRDSNSFLRYLQEVSKLNRGAGLTQEEEVELANRIKNGDKKAETELIERNLRFVISVAKQYQGDGYPLEDLVSEGNFGLIKAARRYDSTKGCKFISYAVWWIRQSILCYLNENARGIRLPLNKISQLAKIKKVQEKFEQEHHRKPTSEEIIEILDFDIKFDDVVNILLIERGSQSLNSDISNNPKAEGFTLEDVIVDYASKGVEDSMDAKDLTKVVKRVLSKIGPKSRMIIEMYYGLNGENPKTLDEIGEELGLTRERIRQVKKDTISVLASAKNHKLLRGYMK